MKGEVQLIRKLYNEFEAVLGYEVIISFDKCPDLKLGTYDIKLKEVK